MSVDGVDDQSPERQERSGLRPHPPLVGGRVQLHLTGFMGSGKSTVGRIVARRLLWNFLDLDGIVERHAAKPVEAIFDEDGEPRFRELERHVLRQVVDKPRTVVALGGGALLDPANHRLVKERAVLAWLRCPLDLLQERCAPAGEASARPLWGDRGRIEELYEARLPGYRTADVIVDASPPPEEVADRLLARLSALEE